MLHKISDVTVNTHDVPAVAYQEIRSSDAEVKTLARNFALYSMCWSERASYTSFIAGSVTNLYIFATSNVRMPFP